MPEILGLNIDITGVFFLSLKQLHKAYSFSWLGHKAVHPGVSLIARHTHPEKCMLPNTLLIAVTKRFKLVGKF
jgi:hypothetical protein